MIPYLLHSALLVSLFYLFYRFVIARETYFRLNRALLITGLVLSLTLPLLKIPASWSIAPNGFAGLRTEAVEAPAPVSPPSARRPMDHTTPIATPPEILAEEPVSSTTETVAETVTPAEVATAPEPSIWVKLLSWLPIFYLIGLVILAFNFLLQIGVVSWRIWRSNRYKTDRFTLVEIKDGLAPHSFWNFILINPQQYEPELYEQVVAHEKIHCRQKHTMDLLLAELMIIIQWFNPLAWFYRRAIENNLEYLTDHTLLDNGIPRQSYQFNLLKIAVPNQPLTVSNHYNQSFLKKRILMMNSKQSSPGSAWKYLSLIPLILLSVICLNATQNPEQETNETNTEMNTNAYDPEGQVDVTGTWMAELFEDKVCFSLNMSQPSRHSHWQTSRCFEKADFEEAPKANSEGEYTVTREAGTLIFKGAFYEVNGQGHHEFKPNQQFITSLKNKGFTMKSKHIVFHLFLSDINSTYVDFLIKNYQITENQLEEVAIFDLNMERLKTMEAEFKALGYKKLGLENYTEASIHDVDAAYARSLRNAGYQDISFRQLVELKIHDVSAEFINKLKAQGFKDLSLREVQDAAIHDIEEVDVEGFAKLGFNNLSLREIVELSIHELSPAYVASMQKEGFNNLSLEEYLNLKIHDVDQEFIGQLKSKGYTNLSAEDIENAAIHDIDEVDVEGFARLGFKDLSIEEITELGIHNLEPSYISGLQKEGLTGLSIRDYMDLKIHDITPRFIQDLRAKGFTDLTANQIEDAAIHDIHRVDVAGFRKLGFTNLSLEKLTEIQIHNLSPAYITSMQKQGFKDLPLDRYIEFKLHEVDERFIKEVKGMGIGSVTNEELLELAIHEVNSNYVKSIQATGLNNLAVRDYIELRIHDLPASFIKKVIAEKGKDVSVDYIVRRYHLEEEEF